MMNELQKIAVAQTYIEQLANGLNPLSGEQVEDSDIINNVHISRCLFYVSGVLKEIVDNRGKYKLQLPEKSPFSLSAEQAGRFEFSKTPVSVSEITKKFNSLIDPDSVKELKLGIITGWLTEVGMLDDFIVNNKRRKRPTSDGISLGISTEKRVSKIGTPYEVLLYNLKAQHFIVDNIDAIVAFNNK